MMVVRFDSEQYSTVIPGKGFSMTVTAEPSGKITFILIIVWMGVLSEIYLYTTVLAFGIAGYENSSKI